jgi:hypothetical protein
MTTLEDILRGELTRHDPEAMSHRPTRGRRGPDPPELDVDLAGRPQGPRLRDATTAGGDDDETSGRLGALRSRRRRLLKRRRGFRARAEDLDPPEPDQDARRLNKILAGGGALVSLVSAVLDSPEGAAAGEGLATGASRNLERRREAFRRRRQSFRESLREARRQNREVNLSINEARTRATESAIDAERQRQADQNAFERKKKLIKLRNRLDNDDHLSDAERRQLDKEIELLDQRIQTERQRGEAQAALAEKRRADAETSSTNRSSAPGGDGSFPSSVNATEQRIGELVEKEQAALDAGATNEELRGIQEKITQLKRHHHHLRRRESRDTTRTDTTRSDSTRTDSMAAPAGRTAPADPSRADTTAPDTTATRGLGRTPGHVAPQELGMKTSGGNPGGGGGVPSSGGARLNADLMGSGDVGARSTESLVDDALTVARNRGPAEAERRLDGLVNQGHLDVQTARAVRRRMQLTLDLDRVALHQSPEAAVDKVETWWRQGRVGEDEATALLDQLVRQYGDR